MHDINSLATSAVYTAAAAAAPAAFIHAETKYAIHLFVTRRVRRPVILRALHCIPHPPFQMENYQIQCRLHDLFTINKITVASEYEI